MAKSAFKALSDTNGFKFSTMTINYDNGKPADELEAATKTLKGMTYAAERIMRPIYHSYGAISFIIIINLLRVKLDRKHFWTGQLNATFTE